MRRQQLLTPAKLTLLMLGVGTVALMGVPGFGRYYPPQGAVTGLVVDTRGLGLDGIEVALFDDHELSLVALTRTDAHGSFAFHQVPPRFHVFAYPVGTEPLVGAWALDCERAPLNHVELTLSAGHALSVAVVDERGMPLRETEVRVYDPGQGAIAVHRVPTDEDGRVALVTPPFCHIAVLGPADFAPAWFFDQEISEQGRSLEVTLRPAIEVAGRVVDSEGTPLAGIVVSGWEFESEEHWTGYVLTDSQGSFRLPTASGQAFVRAVATDRPYLPAVEAVGGTAELAELVLGPGHPLEVRTRSDGEGLQTRLWVWSESAGAWGWGETTDADGLLATVVSTVHGLIAEPLDDAHDEAEALDLTYQGPSRLLPLPRAAVPEPE